MKKGEHDRQSQCPVDYAFQKIGGKYKARILWHLNTGTKRYGVIKKLLPDVTPKMLTQVLRELEADQLIRRHVYLEVPPRVEYSLESSGEAMIPAIKLFSAWASAQMEKNGIPIFIPNKVQMLEV
ncbi:MAG: transcriptional regulator [Mucilaginibacter sp.]|nr:transcriptional regulator [Mucilaginibacter sp.]